MTQLKLTERYIKHYINFIVKFLPLISTDV